MAPHDVLKKANSHTEAEVDLSSATQSSPLELVHRALGRASAPKPGGHAAFCTESAAQLRMQLDVPAGALCHSGMNV